MDFPDVVTNRESAEPDGSEKIESDVFVRRLSKLLLYQDEQKATGWVVGLTGPWGSGKSTILRDVKKDLKRIRGELLDRHKKASAKPIIIVEFNPWVHSGSEALLEEFFNSVFAEGKKAQNQYNGLEDFVGFWDDARKVASRFGSLTNIILPGSGKTTEEIAKESLEGLRDKLNTRLDEAKASVIVLVDEIDRLSDEEVRRVAQVVKSVADFKRFSYLLAYDPERVAKALGKGDDPKLGHYYLEKIVQVQTRLPRFDETQLIEFAGAQIEKILEQYEEFGLSDGQDNLAGELQDVLKFLIPNVLNSPRDVRRLAAAFEARLPLTHGEVGLRDLLRYCALEAKVPILSEKLQSLAKRVSVDGSRELQRRPGRYVPNEKIVREVLGVFDDEPQIRDLLFYLFPALTDQGAEIITRDDNRLCYETPLLTLLHSKPPPGVIGCDRLREALSDPEMDLEELFDEAAQHDRLRHAVLRLRTILHEDKHADGHKFSNDDLRKIWRAVGRYFDRPIDVLNQRDWSQWPDLTHVLVRGAMRGYISSDHLSRRFVNSLLKEGQAHLPATIIYYHLKAHGSFSISKDSSLIHAKQLDKATTESLVKPAVKSVFDRRSKGLDKDTDFFLRSAVPFWLHRLAVNDPTDLSSVYHHSGRGAVHVYGQAILLMRTQHDVLERLNAKHEPYATRLRQFFLLDGLKTAWKKNRIEDPDLGSPITAANSFMSRIEDWAKEPI